MSTSNLSFEASNKLSEANPQQSDYNWGTVEMIKWKDYRGDSLSGLLYKPEDFDPSKKYPTIVYFYESINKLSEFMHVELNIFNIRLRSKKSLLEETGI